MMRPRPGGPESRGISGAAAWEGPGGKGRGGCAESAKRQAAARYSGRPRDVHRLSSLPESRLPLPAAWTAPGKSAGNRARQASS